MKLNPFVTPDLIPKKSHARAPRSLAECQFVSTGSPLRARSINYAGIAFWVTCAVGFVVAIWAAVRT